MLLGPDHSLPQKELCTIFVCGFDFKCHLNPVHEALVCPVLGNDAHNNPQACLLSLTSLDIAVKPQWHSACEGSLIDSYCPASLTMPLCPCSVSKPLQPQEQHNDGLQLLDLPLLGANVAPDQLMERLHLFHAQPAAGGSIVAPAEMGLQLATDCNLDHAALLLGFEPQAAAAQSTLPSMPVTCVNASEVVQACFAKMGGKRQP